LRLAVYFALLPSGEHFEFRQGERGSRGSDVRREVCVRGLGGRLRRFSPIQVGPGVTGVHGRGRQRRQSCGPIRCGVAEIGGVELAFESRTKLSTTTWRAAGDESAASSLEMAVRRPISSESPALRAVISAPSAVHAAVGSADPTGTRMDAYEPTVSATPVRHSASNLPPIPNRPGLDQAEGSARPARRGRADRSSKID
jgi:hypothetical protein